MAKNSSGLHLPGTFTSFPKGPKPAHYAPHPTHAIHQPQAVARTNHQMEARALPARAPRHNITPQAAPSPAPKHNANLLGKEALVGVRGPRHNAQLLSKGELVGVRGPRHNADLKTKDKLQAPRAQWTWPLQQEVADGDPFGNYYFALELTIPTGTTFSTPAGTYEVGHFRECSGIKSSSEVFEIIEGGFNGRTHRRPGQSKWDNIVLKYGVSASTLMLEWRDQMLTDQFKVRCSGSIALMNNKGGVVRRYHFTNAWPVSWEGPSLNSNGSDLAVETIELAHEGVTLSTSAMNNTGVR